MSDDNDLSTATDLIEMGRQLRAEVLAAGAFDALRAIMGVVDIVEAVLGDSLEAWNGAVTVTANFGDLLSIASGRDLTVDEYKALVHNLQSLCVMLLTTPMAEKALADE